MSKIKFGVVTFPGSNCDYDAFYAINNVLGYKTELIWHKDTDLKNSDVIVLPGGFSYGDYLRTGAIARFSPIMDSVIDFALKGGFVLGICNGFQILLEAGLLPGVMLKNESLKFVCKNIYLKIINRNTFFTNKLNKDVIKLPIKHGEGNYFADEKTLNELEENDQIIFKYASKYGEISAKYNPNGSVKNIAGISNREKNILGLMPHPENACDPILGNTDGSLIFSSLVKNLLNLIEV
ncbi:phosphoribosylformylglycinamidine synthase subunit PurQ [Melioribacteraceae bacterium 4301-Me]|uniref:phosphoribosylformylglycinamidine synthase subunit PurQ n=1 Tax=Pyranulibacter aquaticus TaxID=3163344 RepID=UPI00359ACA54